MVEDRYGDQRIAVVLVQDDVQAVGEVKGFELDLGLQRLERGGQDDSESEE